MNRDCIPLNCTHIHSYNMPYIQGMSGELPVEYSNALVSSLDEVLVQQLLTSEHCLSSRDMKEYVS